jgi:hypothetical protein
MGHQQKQSMNTPDALERQVHRIHELLVRSQADVTWNDHVPDPDNPEQLRQNVKWVEELMGRRQSLMAAEIIGVASAGFTAGAQKKAARFGVRLRDFEQLSDEEITN